MRYSFIIIFSYVMEMGLHMYDFLLWNTKDDNSKKENHFVNTVKVRGVYYTFRHWVLL